jgi:putative tryptophan/tyrosine transport system substrate-binding protein
VGQHFNDRMSRRTLLAGIATASAARLAHAQQRGGMRRLGVLMSVLSNDPQGKADAAALVQALGALDWKEGDTLRIDWRWAGGDRALFERDAAELAGMSPDVFVVVGTPAVAAMQLQKTTIPIVFAAVGDPVGSGFVESLAHPGGTITGFSNYYSATLTSKLLQLLAQITPPVARTAVIYNPATMPYTEGALQVMKAAAPSLSMLVQAAPVNDDSDIEAVTAALAREERGGLMVMPGAFTNVHADAIVALAAKYRLPAVYGYRYIVAAGGLMSYGTDEADIFRRVATYVDRILKGAKPGELPVQNPTKFELVINLKTAEALGVTIPTTLLATADEVIE